MSSFKDIMRNNVAFRPILWVQLILNYEKTRYKERKRARNEHQTAEYIQFKRCEPWFRDKGDETLRLDYDLNDRSVVFDIGGYKGEFASLIFDRYNCEVYIFEPIPTFFDILKRRFIRNNRIKLFCLGLSDKTAKMSISLSDNSSSLFIKQEDSIEIQLKRAVEFIREESIDKIDLMKINIEGAEYELLEDLIASGDITRIRNIQVQFHDFIIPNAKERMTQIQYKLSQTHHLTYQYEFVWENWALK